MLDIISNICYNLVINKELSMKKILLGLLGLLVFLLFMGCDMMGSYETINMEDLTNVPEIDAYIERYIQQIRTNIGPFSDYTRIVLRHIKSTFFFKKDGAIDTWQTPKTSFNRMCGDCEDLAFLTSYILTYFDKEHEIILVDTEGGDRMNHAMIWWQDDLYEPQNDNWKGGNGYTIVDRGDILYMYENYKYKVWR
jgi:hypothetical protein